MELSKDIDGQQLNQAFSFAKERAKALHGLKGILSGVVADQELNEKELLFLDSWLKSQEFLHEEKDVVDILIQVGDVLDDGKISLEELALMESNIEHVVDARDVVLESGLGKIDEMIGFLTGVASDGVLNDEEIAALSGWLNGNESIRDVWPASVIVDRLALVLEDGIITDEERSDLLVTVNQITGNETDPNDICYESSTEIWEDKVDSVKFPGSTFCLTGDFVSGDRSAVDTMLHCRGAKISPNVNKQVNYLVIGTLASRDWLYTSHGRKIEKALLLKREGVDITIITERTLLKHTR